MQLFTENVAGFVLAGGKSLRMGQDKALMRFRGRPLVEIALAAVREITADVSVVGSRADLAAFAPVVADAYRDCGPLGGIEAALRASSKEWNVILGVDTPLLPARLLAYLMRRSQDTQAEVTVPRIAGYYEPLCAVYRRPMLAVVQQALERGDYRVDNVFRGRSLCVIEEAELAAIGLGREVFANLNTLAEFQAAEREPGAGSGIP